VRAFGSHTGVAPPQRAALVSPHSTHVLLPGSQAGVVPEQRSSVAHAAHVPARGPERKQMPVRH
jgi:hypothetical protein